MSFQIIGSRPHIRSTEEMALVDKKAVDASFKKRKKESIDPFMAAQGFHKYRTNAYVRVNKIDLLEYVDFQKEHYGSKTFTVNLAVMPLYTTLYEPRDVVAFYVSDRLGKLICGRDIWWDFAEDAVCAASLANVRDALEQFAVPWFRKMANEHYVRLLLLKKKLTSSLSVYDEEWLHAIRNRAERTEIIREHMEQLGLPESLIQKTARS